MDESLKNTLNPADGMFELTLINAGASAAQFEDVVVDALNRGIPAELVTRLKTLWEKTRVVAGEIVAIGKIIVIQIISFLKKYPRISIGLALGAAFSTLIASIPLIGPLIHTEATLVASLYGAGVGAAMGNGDDSGSPFSAAIALAEKFFELLKNVLNSVSGYFDNDSDSSIFWMDSDFDCDV